MKFQVCILKSAYLPTLSMREELERLKIRIRYPRERRRERDNNIKKKRTFNFFALDHKTQTGLKSNAC